MYNPTHIYMSSTYCSSIYLKSAKQCEVFSDSESVKEHIMLWAYSEAVSDLIHVVPDVISIDDCCTSRGGVQT